MLGVLTKDSINKQVKILENKKNNRTIAFFPMVHLGEKHYYESAKVIIDSLRKENFVIFYEGIGIESPLDSSYNDTLNRKLRKLLGFHLSDSYKDSTNESLPNVLVNNQYIMQDYKMMGVNLKEDFRIDLRKDEIIKRYEKDKKSIKLLPCDFTTPLKAKYKCKDPIDYSCFYAVHTLRNNHIIKETLESEKKKIILIYGKAHWKFIYPDLRDAGFEITRGKMFNGIF